MTRTTSIDLTIAIRDMIKDRIGDSNEFFSSIIPASANGEELPDEFILIKSASLQNSGEIKSYGTVEVCLYVRNLIGDNDTSQPDLFRLKRLADSIYPILEDGVKNNTSILNIKDTLVNHSEIQYHYVSLVCETVSIN